MNKKIILLLLTISIASCSSSPLNSMKFGINIGNDLETPGDCGATYCSGEDLCLSS